MSSLKVRIVSVIILEIKITNLIFFLIFKTVNIKHDHEQLQLLTFFAPVLVS
jgi:hypothetical protein